MKKFDFGTNCDQLHRHHRLLSGGGALRGVTRAAAGGGPTGPGIGDLESGLTSCKKMEMLILWTVFHELLRMRNSPDISQSVP